jgi:hypothetical protein
MHIRTECGKIVSSNRINYIQDNKVHIKYETKNHGTDVLRNIKSQGDNLSDVLEVKDIIIFNDNTSTIYDGIKGVIDSFNIFDMIKKVVTHEQYMKLAQEIK